MITFKITCVGINPPTQKQFLLRDNIDEVIFYNTYKVIKTKVDRRLRINLDESVWLYCAYIIKHIRLGEDTNKIIDGLSKLLTKDIVMVGVSEIMSKTNFEITIDDNCELSFEIEKLFGTTDHLIEMR
jgi:urease gamma subunit